MGLTGIIQYSHRLLKKAIVAGETVIDATCGNGKDTIFLSHLVGEDGNVLAFDIQEEAVQKTKEVVDFYERDNVKTIHDSHENIGYYLEEDMAVGAAIFNLGYLPGSDKEIITTGPSTVAAIETILSYLKKDGIIVIVIYHGHAGGKEEKEFILKYAIKLDQKKYNVLKYGFINQKNNPPFILAIQKR